jgi:pimeloyl-ACP methyl ester carboxylesterase
MHPRVDFAHHYTVPAWLAAGFSILAQNSRYVGNDMTMIHEAILLDVAAGIRHLREERGAEAIILLGNSGGGSLFAYYQAQATTIVGQRSAPPGGGHPDLNRHQLPPADALMFLAAHPGQGRILLRQIDPAVVDEADPLANDPALDMYLPEHGFRGPPAESRYAPAFLARFRDGQVARVRRLDERARALIAERRAARWALESGRDDPDGDDLQRTRAATFEPVMVIYRTLANPAFCDLSLDRSERPVGCLISPRPDLANFAAFGFARVVTPAAWLSTWSGLSSRADMLANLPQVTVPTLFVHAAGDTDVVPADLEAMVAASGASDKERIVLPGADHYFRPLRESGGGTHPRASVARILTDWAGARFT